MEMVGSDIEQVKWEVVRYYIVVEDKDNGQIGLRGF